MNAFGRLVPEQGLPCHPTVKIFGPATLAGAAVWLGKVAIPLNFRDGFLFSTLSLATIKIAHLINQKAKLRMPILRTAVTLFISFGVPAAIVHQFTPLNLITAPYLIIVVAATRWIFRKTTDLCPFL